MIKLHCQRGALATAFAVVSAVVPSRTPKPILQNVKLQTAGGKTTLLATDSEIAIRYSVPGVEAEGAGEALLPTRRIVDILRELRDDIITLEIEDDAVWVKAGQSEFRLPIENPAEFPSIAEFDEATYFSVPGRSLKDMIRRTIFATDPESTRYALGGILLELGQERLGLVATDSRRLACVSAPSGVVGTPPTPPTSPVVPSKTMQLVEKTIPDDDSEVHMAIHHPNDVLFRTANATIFSRLVEGRFPRYQDVIPKDTPLSVELNSGSFLTVIRQALIVTNDDSRGVTFDFKDGVLELQSEAADVGRSRIQLPISYSAEPLSIVFDPRYIADFLKVLPPETAIKMNFKNPDDAALLTTDDGYKYVIMPLARDK